MEPASAVVVPVRNGSSANGWAATPRSRARSVCCCIRFAPVLHHCSGEIGPGENIGMPVSNSCGTNASTCACCLPPLRFPPRTRSSPACSVRARASRGLSGSLAMRARKLLGKLRSRCLASQQVLPSHSVSRRRNFAFSRRSTPSSRANWLLRVNPSGLFPRLGLTSSSLPGLFSIPPVWLDPPDFPAWFRMTFAHDSMMSSSTGSLRIAWENRLHRRRDGVLQEDAQVRKGVTPRVLAILNSFLLALFDWLGVTNVASQMRVFAARPLLALRLFFPWRKLNSPG